MATMMRSRLAILAATVLLAAAPASNAAEPPFEIDAVIPATGAYAFQGQDALQALNIIESMTNKSGGIQGRPIKFVVTDDQSSPSNAVQAANRIIAKHATVMLGSVAVSLCNAMAPLVKNGPVMYCFSPGIHPEKGSFVFSSGVSTLDTLAASKNFFRNRGWNKVAFITSTDATGQDADRNIDAIFGDPNGPLTIVAREHFNPEDLSVGAQMAKIKASGAQVLVGWTTGTPFGTVLRNAAEAGLTIPVLTTAGNLSDAQMRAYASFLPKDLYIPATPAFAPDQVPPGPLKRALQAYIDALKSVGAKPENATSLTWDGTLVVIDALRKLGLGATPVQIRDYIAAQRGSVGIYGAHDFVAIPQRGVGIGSVVMIRWDPGRDGWAAASGLGGGPLR
jgi:branched-chain amino acid transport system substrate-binding protein